MQWFLKIKVICMIVPFMWLKVRLQMATPRSRISEMGSSRRQGRSDTVRGHLNRVRAGGRSEETRYAQVRNRVARLENWLNQLNASLTALERRTSPEESRQYISETDATYQTDRRNTETGPMPVIIIWAFKNPS